MRACVGPSKCCCAWVQACVRLPLRVVGRVRNPVFRDVPSPFMSALAATAEGRPRTVWCFSTTLRITEDVDARDEQEFARNTTARWDNPFVEGPSVVVRDIISGRTVGMLIASGPAGVWSTQRCVVVPPGPTTWNADVGCSVECRGTELQDGEGGWTIEEDILDSSEAHIVTYNVAHLLGEQNQMVDSGQILCVADDDAKRKHFSAFHATCLFALQADVILMQEFAGVNKQGPECTEEACLQPIVDNMNSMAKASNSDFVYTAVSVANEGAYWHPYAIISRLPLTNFTQETPKECQGMVGCTVTLPNGRPLRLYTAHLYYLPDEKYQTDEVNAHAKYIANEEESTLDSKVEHIFWGGDFNNRSLECKAMQLIKTHGFSSWLPYYYVDTFFARERRQKPSASDDGGVASETTLGQSYFGPIGNFMTHKYHLDRSDPLYGGGAHSDHLPIGVKVKIS